MNIGYRIKELRKSNNITAEQLAKSCGVTRIYITKLETSEGSTPSLPTLQKICDTFGITLKDFFDDGTGKVYSEKLNNLIDTVKPLPDQYIDLLINIANEFKSKLFVIDGKPYEFTYKNKNYEITNKEAEEFLKSYTKLSPEDKEKLQKGKL